MIFGQFPFEGEAFGAVDLHAVALSAVGVLFLMRTGATEETEAMAMRPEMLFFKSLF